MRLGPRGRRRAAALLISACLPLLGSCRGQRVRAGAELSWNGSTLRLASEAASCGCINLESTTDQQIRLRANYGALTTGEAVLFGHEKLRVKFDWCGSSIEDQYVINAFDATGQPVRFASVARVVSVEPFGRCEELSCDYGALLMRLSEAGLTR